jgi:hypothetical protein
MTHPLVGRTVARKVSIYSEGLTVPLSLTTYISQPSSSFSAISYNNPPEKGFLCQLDIGAGIHLFEEQHQDSALQFVAAP